MPYHGFSNLPKLDVIVEVYSTWSGYKLLPIAMPTFYDPAEQYIEWQRMFTNVIRVKTLPLVYKNLPLLVTVNAWATNTFVLCIPSDSQLFFFLVVGHPCRLLATAYMLVWRYSSSYLPFQRDDPIRAMLSLPHWEIFFI